MLILARRQDESLIITTPSGEKIKILIMDAYHDFAKLGIEAPADYLILREELLDTG
jgi:carbon storage regulator CsrA